MTQNNEVMIVDYYDDAKNVKLFIRLFSLFWLFQSNEYNFTWKQDIFILYNVNESDAV